MDSLSWFNFCFFIDLILLKKMIKRNADDNFIFNIWINYFIFLFFFLNYLIWSIVLLLYIPLHHRVTDHQHPRTIFLYNIELVIFNTSTHGWLDQVIIILSCHNVQRVIFLVSSASAFHTNCASVNVLIPPSPFPPQKKANKLKHLIIKSLHINKRKSWLKINESANISNKVRTWNSPTIQPYYLVVSIKSMNMTNLE